MKDMSGRIAESVEEVDPTLRRTALRILHQMVEPDTFPEIAKKLMEMKSHGSSESAGPHFELAGISDQLP